MRQLATLPDEYEVDCDDDVEWWLRHPLQRPRGVHLVRRRFGRPIFSFPTGVSQ